MCNILATLLQLLCNFFCNFFATFPPNFLQLFCFFFCNLFCNFLQLFCNFFFLQLSCNFFCNFCWPWTPSPRRGTPGLHTVYATLMKDIIDDVRISEKEGGKIHGNPVHSDSGIRNIEFDYD